MPTIDKFCAPGLFDPPTYSQGIKVTQAQTILFLSGQVAYMPDGTAAFRGDFKAQARGAYEAIKALVESPDGTMASIVNQAIGLVFTSTSSNMSVGPGQLDQ